MTFVSALRVLMLAAALAVPTLSCRRDQLSRCGEPVDGYQAASCLASGGFAAHGAADLGADGREVAVWGYVDHGNLFGDAHAKAILGEWWGGKGPDARTWRFNLKAAADDPVGRSFEVRVANGQGRDRLLGCFVADARAGRANRVAIRGKLFGFDAPTSFSSLVGVYLAVGFDGDILLQPTDGPR